MTSFLMLDLGMNERDFMYPVYLTVEVLVSSRHLIHLTYPSYWCRMLSAQGACKITHG